MKHIPITMPVREEVFDPARQTKWFRERLQHLLDDAHHYGVIITVELAPQEPLAMGNYRMIGNVRTAR